MGSGRALGMVLFAYLSNGIRKPPRGVGAGIQTSNEYTEPREVTSTQ